jgi:hypothetical protein
MIRGNYDRPLADHSHDVGVDVRRDDATQDNAARHFDLERAAG